MPQLIPYVDRESKGKQKTKSFCPYFRQIFTDFQNFLLVHSSRNSRYEYN